MSTHRFIARLRSPHTAVMRAILKVASRVSRSGLMDTAFLKIIELLWSTGQPKRSDSRDSLADVERVLLDIFDELLNLIK